VIPYRVLTTYKPSRWRASIVGRDLTAITAEWGLLPHLDKSHGPLHLTGRNWVSYPLHAEVRRRTFNTNQAEGWHTDGDLDPNSRPDCVIVTWASNSPTQIKWRKWPAGSMSGLDEASTLGHYPPFNEPDKEFELIYQAKPYEVVAFKNLSCFHRRPPGCPRVRWLMRQRCDIESAAHLKLP
jgi:hypothetical protein